MKCWEKGSKLNFTVEGKRIEGRMSGGAAGRYRETYLDSDGEERERVVNLAESQETGESQVSTQSATGLSQDFAFMFSESTDAVATAGLPIDSSLTQSIGVVAVVKRDVVHKKQKKVDPYALQRTFYAYPKDANEEMIRSIRDKMDEELADFRLQNYTVDTYKFGLPFAVEKVGRISAGYTGKPKMLKADTKKRKLHEETDGEDGDDGDDDRDYRPSGSNIRDVSIVTRAVADADVIEIVDVEEPRALRSHSKKQRK